MSRTKCKGVKLLRISPQPKAWHDTITTFPLSGREDKPRQTGWTMLLDKGYGLEATRDLLELAADYIDIIKLTFGTSALYPELLLRRKIELIRSYGIGVCPGGTFFEIAFWQGKLDSYIRRAAELGFSCLEISDGTINLSHEARRRCISEAKSAGFSVMTEVGKKDSTVHLSAMRMQQMICADLENGADKVIIEGRESGKGAGIFDSEGNIKPADFQALVYGLSQPQLNALLWEAPLKNQQVQLIRHFGPNVNLGNIAPAEILALESLRCGLRGDTLRLRVQAAGVASPGQRRWKAMAL